MMSLFMGHSSFVTFGDKGIELPILRLSKREDPGPTAGSELARDTAGQSLLATIRATAAAPYAVPDLVRNPAAARAFETSRSDRRRPLTG